MFPRHSSDGTSKETGAATTLPDTGTGPSGGSTYAPWLALALAVAGVLALAAGASFRAATRHRTL